MFGPNLKGAFQISPPKIGQFVSNCRKGYKFQILLAFFCLKVSWLNQKTITEVSFCDTKGPCKHNAKTECCFPNQPPENWAISLECVNRVQISNLIGFFVWKVNCLKQSFSQQLYFVTLKGCGMCWPKLKAAFQVSAPKIGKFLWRRRIGSKFQILLLSFLWNVSWLNQKPSQEFHFTTLKGSANIGPKLNASFQIKPLKIGPFISSWQIGSKFEILLVCFFWKVTCLKQSFSEDFYFVTLKGMES